MSTATLARWEGQDVDHWRRLWQTDEVHFFDIVTSTNDVATQLAAAGAPHFSVVVADEQTRGRGRGGSLWQARRGTSLLVSVLLKQGRQGSTPGCAPVRVGLAVAEAISEITGSDARVKWPNDVVMPPHGKVAGVLCEGSVGPERAGYIVAGIGINVLQESRDFPSELRGRACSLLTATDRYVSRADVLSAVLDRLKSYAVGFTEPLNADELTRFAARDVLRDQNIVCDIGNGETVTGIAAGIGEDGALLIRQHDRVIRVYNGTVRLSAAHSYPGSA